MSNIYSLKFFVFVTLLYPIVILGEDNLYQTTLEESIAAYKQGQINQAVELLKKCTILDRQNYLSWYWGGMMSDPERAIWCFDKAIELAPNNADSYAMRGYLRLRKASTTLDSDYLAGMKDISKALSIEFDNIPACYYKAGDLIRAGSLFDAIPYLQRVIGKKSQKQLLCESYLFNYQEHSYHSLAYVYKQFQKYDTALEYVDIAIKSALTDKTNNNVKNKDDIIAYYQMRYEINKIVNKENAIQDIDKILEIDSSFLNKLICHKIDMLVALNKTADAIKVIKETITKLSVNSKEYIWCVHCLGIKLGVLDDAIIALERYDEIGMINLYSAGQIDDKFLNTYYLTKCLLNEKKGDFNNAYHYITKAVKLTPKESQLYLLRAKLLLKLNRTDEAKKDLECFQQTFDDIIVTPDNL